jgi:hypothetical protein
VKGSRFGMKFDTVNWLNIPVVEISGHVAAKSAKLWLYNAEVSVILL